MLGQISKSPPLKQPLPQDGGWCITFCSHRHPLTLGLTWSLSTKLRTVLTTAKHPIIQQALALLACEMRETDVLKAPDAVKDYLRLKLAPKPHEVFAVGVSRCPEPRH